MAWNALIIPSWLEEKNIRYKSAEIFHSALDVIASREI